MDLRLPEKRVFIGPASLWKRMLALVFDILLLDIFVLGAFNSVVERMIGTKTGITALYSMLEQNSTQVQALTLLFMIVILITLAYFVLLQYATGQTLGCILLNIHVVEQAGEKDFRRPKFWQSLVRNLFLIPAVPFIFLWIIEPVYLYFAKKNQRLTEWLSNTLVVERFEI